MLKENNHNLKNIERLHLIILQIPLSVKEFQSVNKTFKKK